LTVIAIPFIVEAYVKLEPNTKASRNLCILRILSLIKGIFYRKLSKYFFYFKFIHKNMLKYNKF
ncbi:MAG: hypothetical protein KA157_12315, partial [Aliarcobacter sp.]|nr:hypothetical protein [Aliarcobacter sp.]